MLESNAYVPSQQINRENTAIVLTATIDPFEGTSARADPLLREDDYLKAVHYWLDNERSPRNIVFIENSGWPLDKFERIASNYTGVNRVELITLATNKVTAFKGKGYSEWRLLEEGLAMSQLAKKSDYCVKITGRLIVRNLPEVLSSLPASTDLALDNLDSGLFRTMSILLGKRNRLYNKWLDSRLIVWSQTYWEDNLKTLSVLIESSSYGVLERVLYDFVREELPKHDRNIVYRLRVLPIWSGICAGNNEVYGGTRNRFRHAVSQALRSVEHNLGLKYEPE